MLNSRHLKGCGAAYHMFRFYSKLLRNGQEGSAVLRATKRYNYTRYVRLHLSHTRREKQLDISSALKNPACNNGTRRRCTSFFAGLPQVVHLLDITIEFLSHL